MATYYLNHASGNDGSAGTAAGTAWKTIGKAMQTVAAGDLVNVLGDALSPYDDEDGTTDAIGKIITAGTAAAPIRFRGYTTTPGDGGTASLNAATNSLVNGIMTALTTNLFYVFENISVFGSSGDAFGLTVDGDAVVFKNCQALTCGGIGIEAGESCIVYGCNIQSCTDVGISLQAYGQIIGNSVSLCDGANQIEAGTHSVIVFNQVYGADSDGQNQISAGVASFVFGNTIDGGLAASTVGIYAGGPLTTVLNNVVYRTATGIQGDAPEAAAQTIADYNAYSRISGSLRTNFPTGAHDLELGSTEPGFVNPNSFDFSITADSALFGTGFPENTDIGAYSAENGRGSGCGIVLS